MKISTYQKIKFEINRNKNEDSNKINDNKNGNNNNLNPIWNNLLNSENKIRIESNFSQSKDNSVLFILLNQKKKKIISLAKIKKKEDKK